MILRHWSEQPLGPLRSVVADYRDGRPSIYGKPNGFWLSDESTDDGWSHWCRSEDFGDRRLRYYHDFDADLTDVLHMSTAGELVSFTKKYKNHKPGYGAPIDWPRVGQKFKGVLITPYVYSCRLAFSWYYTWDCASGVFWDTSCLTEIKRGRAADLEDVA